MTVETVEPVTGQATPNAGVQPNVDPGTLPEGSVTPAPVAPGADEGATKNEPEAEISYEFVMPEGIEPDAKATEEFVAIAKELKLPKEGAQKLVDLAIARDKAQAEAFSAQVQAWEATVVGDKELGGAKLQETLAVCQKAIALGPPELKDLLSSTKMGSHPAVVKWAYAVGKALSEDNFVPGGSGAPKGAAGAAQVLYPNQS